MENVANMVSRTPPEGVLEWAGKQADMQQYGLLYEIEWAMDTSFEAILDDFARGRKVKMVRAWCSCCGEEGLFRWCHTGDRSGGYGFLHEMHGETVLFASGDESICPFCGCPVKVKKAAELGRYGYYVTDYSYAMSASVVGLNHLLALTGWLVERRAYRNGRNELNARPMEAYVFNRYDCAMLNGWVKAYSGNAGYFKAFKREWKQLKDWSETWMDEQVIYGLTPELLASSCIPDCKLDVYMDSFSTIRKKYPVAYMRLYQYHQNVENLVMSGLPLVLDDLLAEQMISEKWKNNKRGVPILEGIDWDEARPAQMLGLTKEELRLGQEQRWGALFWRLFIGAKKFGERLTVQDIQNAHYLGDENVLRLVGKGPISKSLRYMLRQYEEVGPGAEDKNGDPEPYAVFDVNTLVDYWDMCERLGRDLSDPQVRWPWDLLTAHDQVSEQVRVRKGELLAKAFRRRKKALSRYAMEADGLLIVPAGSQKDLDREAKELHHCVWTYGENHASGKTAIFFIRRKEHPRRPYYTLELDEKNMKVKQNRGLRNCQKTEEVQAFENLWISWVRYGAKRDKDGNPVLPQRKRRKTVA